LRRTSNAAARTPAPADSGTQASGHAQEGETLFISWRGFATVGGAPAEWEGIDRMTIRAGVVVDSLVVFDRSALGAA
jgi:hypothetical protein